MELHAFGVKIAAVVPQIYDYDMLTGRTIRQMWESAVADEREGVPRDVRAVAAALVLDGAIDYDVVDWRWVSFGPDVMFRYVVPPRLAAVIVGPEALREMPDVREARYNRYSLAEAGVSVYLAVAPEVAMVAWFTSKP
jgi:hypothetical protein